MRKIAGAFGLTAVAFVAACGSSAHHPGRPLVTGFGQRGTSGNHAVHLGTSTGSGPSAPDACALLTDTQITSATAATVVEHHPSFAQAGASACVWTLRSTNVADVGNPSLKVTAEPDTDLGAGVDTFQDATRGFGPVTGLGERAASGQSFGEGPVEVVVLQHRVVYIVMTQVAGHPEEDETYNELLARDIVTR